MDAKDALKRAIKEAGSQQELGKRIGVPQSLVSYWLNKAKIGIAAEYVHATADATGIPAHELRPDIFPPNSPAAQPEQGRAL